MLRMAVIGVGWAGTRHVEAVRELGRKIEVVALVDNDPDHLKQSADELNIGKTYTRYEDALNDPNIDAVSICSPHAFHCPMTLEAVAAGKHALVEKPMAMNMDEATRMIDAAHAAGVKLYVAENETYQPMSKFLRALVASGEHTGELTGASVMKGFRAENFRYPGRRAWLTLPDKGGTGTWMLQGVHTVAQLRYVLGEVETVYIRDHRAASFQRADLEATMSGVLTLESGLNVALTQSCETRFPPRYEGYTLYGERATVHATNDGYEVIPTDGGDPTPTTPYDAEPLSAYAQEMEAFADYVTDGIEGPTSGVSERRSLAIIQAGYESAESGLPIILRERFGEL